MRSLDVWMELKVELLLLPVEGAQLRQLGYLARIPPGLLPEEVFQACSLVRRPQCRSRTRWRDYLFLTGGCLGIPSKEPPRSRRQMDSHDGFKQWLEKEIPPDLWNVLLKWNNRASGFAGASNGGPLCADFLWAPQWLSTLIWGRWFDFDRTMFTMPTLQRKLTTCQFSWSKSSWTFGMEGKGTMSVAQFNSSSTRTKSCYNPEKRHISTNIVLSLYLGSKCKIKCLFKGQRLFVTW